MDQQESSIQAVYNVAVRIAVALERIAMDVERIKELIDKGKCH